VRNKRTVVFVKYAQAMVTIAGQSRFELHPLSWRTSSNRQNQERFAAANVFENLVKHKTKLARTLEFGVSDVDKYMPLMYVGVTKPTGHANRRLSHDDAAARAAMTTVPFEFAIDEPALNLEAFMRGSKVRTVGRAVVTGTTLLCLTVFFRHTFC
jgi:hypothetical protein